MKLSPQLLLLSLVILLAAVVCACDRPSAGAREVVLYSSVDDHILQEVVRAFEASSGITVRVVGDTEATKTTGLVQRMLAEKDRPRADVWWSNEPYGTIRLGREGLLAPHTSPAAAEFKGGWPPELRADDGTWFGFALRRRAVVYNTKKLDAAAVPADLQALTDPKWKGRIGMARPQFGTTRGQMAAVLAQAGPGAYRAWLEGLKANNVRLYDGNSTMVRAVAQGEVDIGLTDTDDVYGGQREEWPVNMVLAGFGGGEALPIPNTIGLVKGGPNPKEAAALIDFVLGEPVERILAQGEARHAPVRPALAAELGFPSGTGAIPDFEAVEGRMAEAMKIWDEVFGG